MTLLLTTEVFAQFEKGDFLLRTNILASQNNNEQFFFNNESYESYIKRLESGLFLEFFLKESLSINFGISRSFTEQSGYQFVQSTLEYNEFVNKRSMTSFNLGAQIYFNLSKKFWVKNGLNTNFGIGKSEPELQSPQNLKSEIHRLGFSFNHGVVYQLSKSFTLSTSIGSLYYVYEIEDPEDFDANLVDTSYGINFSLSSLSFGFAYKF